MRDKVLAFDPYTVQCDDITGSGVETGNGD